MKIGFIGTGNMGGILAAAVAKSLPSPTVLLADCNTEKATALAAEIGGQTADNKTVAETADILFLGVKPQVLPAVAEEIKPYLAARKTRFVVVTMAAGVAVEQLNALLGADYPTIRIMPNTPAAVSKGLILFCPANGVTDEELTAFKTHLAPAGNLLSITEDKIDAAGAVSGCGPAFVYLFIEALADGGVACGLPRETAMTAAAQTVCGAAEMVLQTGLHPGVLKDAVCSPGGTTIAGVEALEQCGFRGTVMEGIRATVAKAEEMSK